MFKESLRTPAFRWMICLLLFAATAISYVDRQILSLLKPILDHELKWTNEEFGWINACFQGAYALSYLGFGWLIDRIGVKIGYSLSIAVWSIAAALHATVNTISGFGIARVLLGLGEGGNFPAAIKAVAIWFSPRERAFATTLFNSGANVGALLAPAIIPGIALAMGWHGTFLLAGGAGFVWLFFWLILYRAPRAGQGAVKKGRNEDADGEGDRVRWTKLFRLRQTWAYILARALTDPVWWFFLIWLPDYFQKTRNLDLKAMGLPLVVIYAIVTVLSIFGGWIAKWLSDIGWPLEKTRKVTLLIFACSVVPVIFATHAGLWMAVIIIGVAGGAHQAWSATLYTTVSDQFPKSSVASVIGLGGMAGSIAGMFFPIICGRVLDVLGSAGYSILFIYCGVAYIIAYSLHRLICPDGFPVKSFTGGS